MFFSQLMLSKKGALGVVWTAAHSYKKLKKEEIQATNICTSVDKIISDGVPVVTHRILAFLLLGIVRIYSKQVDYLYNDCDQMRKRLCGLKSTRRSSADGVIQVSQRRYHSIMIPERFELDAFDLGDQESEGRSLSSRDQPMHAGGQRKRGSTRGSLEKADISFPGACSTSHTPPRDVLSSASRNMITSLEDHTEPMVSDEAEEVHNHGDTSFNEDPGNNFQGSTNDDMEYDYSHNRSLSLSSWEILRGTRFGLDDRFDPMVLDEAEREQMNARPFADEVIRTNFQEQSHDIEVNFEFPSPHGNDSVSSLGILQNSGSSLDHFPGFRMSGPSETENTVDVRTQLNFQEDEPVHLTGTFDNADTTATKTIDIVEVVTPEIRKGLSGHADKPSEKEQTVDLRTQLNVQDDEPVDLTGTVDNTDPAATNNIDIVEVVTPEIRIGRTQGKYPTPDLTPEVTIPEASDGTADAATIPTPASVEPAKTPKKRKALIIDPTTIVANKEYKNWLNDPRDLKRKNKKVSRSSLTCWRTQKFSHLSRSFLEPSIPGISVALASLKCKKSYTVTSEPVMTSSASEDDIRRSPVTPGVPEQAPAVGSPDKPTDSDQVPIAPGTPVTHLDSFRSLEAGAIAADSDILEPTTSPETIQKPSSFSEGPEFDAMFEEETNSSEDDTVEKDIYSARTRATEEYLRKKFEDGKKEKETPVLNLSSLVAGKTKKESARLFYEILVLKTRDSIDVQQENAYDDILLRETKQT